MSNQDMMYYATMQESALDREIVRRTKQARQRRAVHHDHNPNRKSVRANPNKER